MCGKLKPWSERKRKILLARFPRWLHNQVFAVVERLDDISSHFSPLEDDVRKVVPIEDAQVITSRVDTAAGEHYRPVLDLDFEVHVERSTTPGHYHLYLDRWLSREQYTKLLDVLEEVGIIEWGFATRGRNSSLGTAARLPWIRKPKGVTSYVQGPF